MTIINIFTENIYKSWKVDEKDIPTHDILCAGFPCQAFSISGKQKGFEDTRGNLFKEVVRIAKYHQPELLLLENVKNLEKHDDGRTFKVIKENIENISYNKAKEELDTYRLKLSEARVLAEEITKLEIPNN